MKIETAEWFDGGGKGGNGPRPYTVSESLHQEIGRLVKEAEELRNTCDPRSPNYSYFDGKIAGLLGVWGLLPAPTKGQEINGREE